MSLSAQHAGTLLASQAATPAKPGIRHEFPAYEPAPHDIWCHDGNIGFYVHAWPLDKGTKAPTPSQALCRSP
jgi:hypothetical protein